MNKSLHYASEFVSLDSARIFRILLSVTISLNMNNAQDRPAMRARKQLQGYLHLVNLAAPLNTPAMQTSCVV